MKVLVIGGTGFIGLNIAEKLASRTGYTVTLADNLFRGKHDPIVESLITRENVSLVNADFTNPKSYELLEDDYDHVYMLASVVGVQYTIDIPDELIRINTCLILNTLEWLKSSKCKKVLFSSTSECYSGTVDEFSYKVPTDEKVPLCIPDIKNPRFSYAVTKMLGESGFLNYSKKHNFEATIIRFHNVYGPRMGFKHVVPQITHRFFLKERDFKIFGYNQTRAFNHISDAVAGTIAAMESANTNGEIIHLGDANAEISIKTLVDFVGELMNYDGDFELVSAQTGL